MAQKTPGAGGQRPRGCCRLNRSTAMLQLRTGAMTIRLLHIRTPELPESGDFSKSTLWCAVRILSKRQRIQPMFD